MGNLVGKDTCGPWKIVKKESPVYTLNRTYLTLGPRLPTDESVVYIGADINTDEKVTIKMASSTDSQNVKNFCQQALILEYLRDNSCDRCIQLLGNCFQTRKNLWLVMEYLSTQEGWVRFGAPGVSGMRQLPLTEQLRAALKLTKTVMKIHQLGVAHSNIRPRFVMYHPESKQLKLLGFDYAVMLEMVGRLPEPLSKSCKDLDTGGDREIPLNSEYVPIMVGLEADMTPERRYAIDVYATLITIASFLTDPVMTRKLLNLWTNPLGDLPSIKQIKNMVKKRMRKVEADGIQVYLTLNNGGHPYAVSVTPSSGESEATVKVFEWDRPSLSGEWTGDLPPDIIPLETYSAKEVFIGKDPVRPEKGEGGDEGNSILLRTGKNKYVFIGDQIFSFETDDPIIDFHSWVGQSAVPYPVAVGEENAYFMLDQTKVARKHFPDDVEWGDAYTVYYESIPELAKISLIGEDITLDPPSFSPVEHELRCEGYWDSSRKPKVSKQKWKGKKTWMNRVKRVEAYLKNEQPDGFKAYRMIMESLLEPNVHVRGGEYKDVKHGNICWSQDYVEHYIGKHNVMPTERFYRYINKKYQEYPRKRPSFSKLYPRIREISPPPR